LDVSLILNHRAVPCVSEGKHQLDVSLILNHKAVPCVSEGNKYFFYFLSRKFYCTQLMLAACQEPLIYQLSRTLFSPKKTFRGYVLNLSLVTSLLMGLYQNTPVRLHDCSLFLYTLLPSIYYVFLWSLQQRDTVVRRLTTGMRSEECVVRRFRRCANVIDCTYTNLDTDMRHLTTWIRSENCVVRRFRRCANVIECIYTNLDSTVLPTTHLGYCS
jgi:hypothetical protein